MHSCKIQISRQPAGWRGEILSPPPCCKLYVPFSSQLTAWVDVCRLTLCFVLRFSGLSAQFRHLFLQRGFGDVLSFYFFSFCPLLLVRLRKLQRIMQDQRVCPGRTGKKCIVFMSPLIRDPHIHCPRCRGNKCTIDKTCIICKSWPPEQWELFAKKKSYAHSKARRGRSVSMSASPAPSVAGTSVGRPSVPPASPPPSRDQVVMGGQTSVGVSVSCLGSAPSGSVTMATCYISDDVVAASPDPPPASGGEGGQEKLPPACSPIPGPSSSRLLSPGRREKRLDPSGSSHAGPPRSPSAERERGGKRRGKRSCSPSFPSRYRSRSSSGERGIPYCATRSPWCL